MMQAEAMDPHGMALLDFFNGETEAQVLIHRDDGLVSELAASAFFREPTDFSPLEQAALALCRGRVLDVGAGAGAHSLVLQERGFSVCAIDISMHAVKVMKRRGIHDARCVSIDELGGERFDTLLMMMHGIGLVQTLSGLDRFLRDISRLLNPEGQIVVDSLDCQYNKDPVHLAYLEANRQAGRYYGEMRMWFEYKDRRGPLCGWLHVDPETMAEHAERAGWMCEIVHQAQNGDYLARLTRLKSGLEG
jgi:SAM-dependent methyltransferase